MTNPLPSLKRYCILKFRRCDVCQVCDTSKKLIIHHKKYFDDSVIYKQFSDTHDGRIQYYAKLLDEIEKRPTNFNSLCMNCHDHLHKILNFSNNKLDDYCNSILNSRFEIIISDTYYARHPEEIEAYDDD